MKFPIFTSLSAAMLSVSLLATSAAAQDAPAPKVAIAAAYTDELVDEVIFAGDSGNDLPVLTSQIPSVLVDNASAEIKQAAVELSKHNGHAEALFLAKSHRDNEGNYAAGVLQGVAHFAPHFVMQTNKEASS